MSKHLQLAAALVLLIGLQACTSSQYLSTPAGPDFLIDGQATEWTGRFKIPKHAKFAVAVSYDRNYLYLALNSRDRGFEKQLAIGGLKVWLDPQGKKHNKLAVEFKGRTPNNRNVMRQGGHRSMRSERLEGEPRGLRGDLELIIVEAGRERLGPADLLAVANSGSGGLFIEYQIPRTLLGSMDTDQDVIGIGLESSIERPEGLAGDRRGLSRGGGMSMAGGNPMGGHQGGGGRGSGTMSGGRSSQLDEVDIWLKVQMGTSD